jgi:diacylglycerol kinase
MIKEKIKKTIKKAKQCGEFAQCASMGVVLALIIVLKSQRYPSIRKDTKKNKP